MNRSGLLADFVTEVSAWSCALIGATLLLTPTYAVQNLQKGTITPPKAIAVQTHPIKVDGLLNESIWQASPSIGEIVQREPQEGAPATERTEVRLLFDENHLYIGVSCYDSDPDGIISTQMSRDANLSVDDRVEVLIDTFHDRRNAFYFSTNPNGALVDGLIIENGQLNREWDAIWEVQARRTEEGWSAEFAIPFKSLNFNRNRLSWGFNFSRSIKRKIEEDRWAAPRLDIRFFQVSEAGEIEGLTEIEQGHGLDVRPYLASDWDFTKATKNHSANADAGLDISYNITPSLKLLGTINTDFAETEVDNRQINLTRFPLFFPEKRSFFLENTGVFNFGFVPGRGSASGTGNRLIPFFSRRIGLISGQEIPISVGLKLTGKVNRYDFGVIDVRTQETLVTPAQNFLVVRAKRNLWRQSYVGGIYTAGDPATLTYGRTFGADIRLGTSTFLGKKRNFIIDAYALKSANEGVRDKNTAYGFGVSFPNDLWGILADWRRIERNFRPALGFVSRPNVSRLNIAIDFAPRPHDFLSIRRMVHEFRFTRSVHLDHGRVENWRVFTAPINYTWNSGDRFEVNWVSTFERLFEPFEISDNVILPPGDYRFDRYRVEYSTSNRRPWKADLTWWFGTFWSGRANQIRGRFQYNWAPHMGTSFRYDQTFARLPEGNFVARIFSLGGNYSFSPMLTLFNLAQYDNDSKNLSWQSRVRWILRPGREIFLVFSQGWIREEDSLGSTFLRAADTGIAVKAQYTFRF